MISRLHALQLLEECTGVDIWPVDYCRQRGVPPAWIEEFADAYESGFDNEMQTIFFQDRPVNQFHGVLDLHLAKKLGEFLGIDVERASASALSREEIVRAIQEAVEEG